MSDADQQPVRPKDERPDLADDLPARDAGDPIVQNGPFRSAARFLLGSVGCLIFLFLAAAMALWAVAVFLDDPAFALAGVALLVALSARKAAKEVRKR